jgi:hypothetical protein
MRSGQVSGTPHVLPAAADPMVDVNFVGYLTDSGAQCPAGMPSLGLVGKGRNYPGLCCCAMYCFSIDSIDSVPHHTE